MNLLYHDFTISRYLACRVETVEDIKATLDVINEEIENL